MLNLPLIKNFILTYRRLFIIGVQTVLIPLSYMLSFALRFDFFIVPNQFENFIKTIPFLILLRLFFFYYFDLFSGWWRFVSTEDIIKITKAVVFSSVCFVASVVFLFNLTSFPRSVFIIDALIIFLSLCGIRLLIRLLREGTQTNKNYKVKKNVLILGAGSAGVTVLSEIRNSPGLQLNPVGFIDDNPSKMGYKIRGLEVIGTRTDIPKLVSRYDVHEVIIAMPSAPHRDLQEIVTICEKVNIKSRTLPRISDILTGKTFFSQLRDVHPDELLGRPSISFRRESDRISLQKELSNKCVLVTGAGGSIGSELCRQIALFNPKTIILYERSEENIYFIDLELRRKFPQLDIISIMGDILNKEKFKNILLTYAPDIVYHAAAYKHVPLMEKDPLEALTNNVIGTKTIADLCIEHGIRKFIFISTDKAVNPSSIMGTTKRITEKLLQIYGNEPTRFISVRFGNVVGSSGSVIPLFKRQIVEGGPITITHPEATRFLMTIPEAVQLVLLAGSLGDGGEIFLLDMGEPVKIIDLAKNLIELSGLVPYKDINIEFIGLRDGEKLHEELYWEGEDIVPTTNKKIRKLSNSHFNLLNYKFQITRLEKALVIFNGNENEIYELMKEMVPEASISPLQKAGKQL
ncbi:MAG: nucleoside-diphosphate sugar epimerase/dehydratase [Proteobacteria bacterium]|nr:nucleoside-diphosphate sugar epimerase/dehydratase [Pseudomonadota bacterium]